MIVGGGIGGAVLALALGQQGHQVALLERERQASTTGRPEVLAGSTIETFHRLGAGSRILREAALPLLGLQLWRAGGRPVFALSAENFQQANAQPYSTDPARTRAILLEQAAVLSTVKLHRGVEVHDLMREGARVVGVHAVCDGQLQTFRARLVVGDDGGASRVRLGLGIPLVTQEFPLDFVTVARTSTAPAESLDGIGQAWIQPRATREGIFGGIFLPLPGGREAMVWLMASAAYERFTKTDSSAFYEEAARLSPRCADLQRQFRFPQDFVRIKRPFGHVPRYIEEGAVLLGDAAHPVTPAGGQGANMSVADAVVLAEVAHDALKAGDCSASRLAAYEQRRRPSNERSLQFSVRTAWVVRQLQTSPWLAPLLPWVLGTLNHSTALKQRLVHAVSQTFATPEGI